MPPRLLITRPEPNATRLAEALRADLPGVEIITSPLMRIDYGGRLPAIAAGTVLVFTSRHGVAGFCRLSALRDLRACAVGCATAAEARRQGFDTIAASGDAASLLDRITADGMTGPFLHLRGAHVAADIVAALRRAGREAQEAVVYDQQAQPLSAAARAVLDGQSPVILPLMSPRSAALFFDAAGATRAPLLVAAMSRNVAERIPAGAAQRVDVAGAPDAASMRTVLEDLVKSAKRVESPKSAQ